jgi:D-aminopeptidase
MTNGSQQPRPRARDIGVVLGEHPTGPHNAITDVAGVRVGHTTIQLPGPNPVNTGVTVVVPHPGIFN